MPSDRSLPRTTVHSRDGAPHADTRQRRREGQEAEGAGQHTEASSSWKAYHGSPPPLHLQQRRERMQPPPRKNGESAIKARRCS